MNIFCITYTIIITTLSKHALFPYYNSKLPQIKMYVKPSLLQLRAY